MAIPPSSYLTTSNEKKMIHVVVLAKEENDKQQMTILDGSMEPVGSCDYCGFTKNGEGD
jgi:hypothetical protein